MTTQANFPLPVFFMTDGVELPKQGNYYVVARDGIYLHKDTGLIEATVRVDKISFLNPLATKANVRLPVIPPELAAQALLFFRKVFQLHHAEAVLLIHYSQERGYQLSCPKQEVGWASVSDYNRDERVEGCRMVGTFHSHCDFGAFHSGTDVSDEASFDGIHITIGRVDQPYFTISATAVVNNNRFAMEPERAIAGLHLVDFVPSERSGYRRYKIPRLPGEPFNTNQYIDLLLDDVLGLNFLGRKQPLPDFYEILLPNMQDYRNVSVPASWLSQLTVNHQLIAGPKPWEVFARAKKREEAEV